MRPEIESAIESLRRHKRAYLEVPDILARCRGFASDGRFHALVDAGQTPTGYIVAVSTAGVHELVDTHKDYHDPHNLEAIQVQLGATLLALSPIGGLEGSYAIDEEK